jgi:dephospho-CoA kinase
MLLVGLTGGIGSGKSTVAQMLAERGAVVLDADAFARGALEHGSPGFDRAVQLFGPQVVSPDGDLDRTAIARRVFADEDLRRKLEEIVHPEVRRLIAKGITAHANSDRVVVVDTPLLIETGAQDMFEVVVLVSSEPAVQIERLTTGRSMSAEDAQARIRTQMPTQEKARFADVILDNDGTLEELEGEVEVLWQGLLRRSRAAEAGDAGEPAAPIIPE